MANQYTKDPLKPWIGDIVEITQKNHPVEGQAGKYVSRDFSCLQGGKPLHIVQLLTEDPKILRKIKGREVGVADIRDLNVLKTKRVRHGK